jgi:hypothetical protein
MTLGIFCSGIKKRERERVLLGDRPGQLELPGCVLELLERLQDKIASILMAVMLEERTGDLLRKLPTQDILAAPAGVVATRSHPAK